MTKEQIKEKLKFVIPQNDITNQIDREYLNEYLNEIENLQNNEVKLLNESSDLEQHVINRLGQINEEISGLLKNRGNIQANAKINAQIDYLTMTENVYVGANNSFAKV